MSTPDAPMPPLTPEAKSRLSKTVRALRERLLVDVHDRADSVYRLAAPIGKAGLAEEHAVKRRRLEEWIDEQARSQRAKGESLDDARERHRREAEKLAAATFLNRLVVVKHLETMEFIRPKVLTGGWDSPAYRELRDFAPELLKDETEGYSTLLKLLFDELALRLPGLFGEVGVSALFEIPPSTLRHVVEALDDPELKDAWADDTTLGWVYQYWNDPEREALDAKLNAGGKVEPHEIASKTQMFTERYMVEWLLHNSLGQMWLAMCRKHGWTPKVEADGTLDRLEERRKAWRAKREAGEVELVDLMPIESSDEERWKYWVPQPMPEDAVETAPESVREIKILDPACGSGHFLVIAFDLLMALYQEEARHRGEKWTDRAIVESIAENNLHGIDIDPWAVQIAAAALLLKVRQACPEAHPRRLNLVASNLRLASLEDDDPALVELRREIREETGIPESLTDEIVHALKGADHLGSLLKVDAAVGEAIRRHEEEGRRRYEAAMQGNLFGGFEPRQQAIDFDAARQSVLDRLESFLLQHTGGDDLGLRLRGEQLAAGIRFVRLLREGSYDLVVGNPPYQGTAKMLEDRYVKKHYPRGKADLYAAFLERGLQLVRPGGVSALLTMRNWMFIKQYAELRQWLLEEQNLRAVGDLSWGAFEEMRDNPVAISIFSQNKQEGVRALAIAPTDPQERVRTLEELNRKRAGILCHVGRHEFDPAALKVVPEWPLVYWWNEEFVQLYSSHLLLAVVTETRRGATTGNNGRFLRNVHEVSIHTMECRRYRQPKEQRALRSDWVPYIKGAGGRQWCDSLTDVIRWSQSRLELALSIEHSFGEGSLGWKLCNEPWDEVQGVAYSTIGSTFSARLHRYHSVVDVSGATLVPGDLLVASDLVCRLNSKIIRRIANDLNPSVNFQLADLKRVPFFPVSGAQEIIKVIDEAFCLHEATREPSVEFRQPGPSPWLHAQTWAQAAVDRPDGTPLLPYEPVYDPETPTDHISFAFGVALGRFGPTGEGILDPTEDALDHALPSGICFLDGTLDQGDHQDSLGHSAAAPLHTAWSEYGPAVDAKTDLRTWLRLKFFLDVHKSMYENRPIHWPLSSSKRTFVAWVTIHRWTVTTLKILLADHLRPTLGRFEGELADLLEARNVGDRSSRTKAEQRYNDVRGFHEELTDLIAKATECAERGAPPPDGMMPPREADAPYVMDLDDGVMINSAALWPLLEPQWKDPKKWWSELCNAKGKKDYDWSHLAARYFPTRVDEKCREDPSHAVAHGCFWKYHPEKAYQWELRLQDEIAPDFTLDEADSDACRAAFEAEHPEKVKALIAAEEKRREKKRKKAEKAAAKKKPKTVEGPLFANQEAPA